MTEDVKIDSAILQKALRRAVRINDGPLITKLVHEEGADPNRPVNKMQDTHLHVAARLGVTNSLVALLSLKADTSILNKRKKTPAMVAHDYGHDKEYSHALRLTGRKRLRSVPDKKEKSR